MKYEIMNEISMNRSVKCALHCMHQTFQRWPT